MRYRLEVGPQQPSSKHFTYHVENDRYDQQNAYIKREKKSQDRRGMHMVRNSQSPIAGHSDSAEW